MREQKRSSFSPPALGGASLLVIFAVLALTIFALLSLSTVQADRRLSEASNEAVQEYYAADCTAQAVLAWLRTGESGAGVPEDLEISTTISEYADHSETVYSYAVPISDSQELQVEVLVAGPNEYEILRWQAVPVGDWELVEGMDLWDMDEMF